MWHFRGFQFQYCLSSIEVNSFNFEFKMMSTKRKKGKKEETPLTWWWFLNFCSYDTSCPKHSGLAFSCVFLIAIKPKKLSACHYMKNNCIRSSWMFVHTPKEVDLLLSVCCYTSIHVLDKSCMRCSCSVLSPFLLQLELRLKCIEMKLPELHEQVLRLC